MTKTSKQHRSDPPAIIPIKNPNDLVILSSSSFVSNCTASLSEMGTVGILVGATEIETAGYCVGNVDGNFEGAVLVGDIEWTLEGIELGNAVGDNVGVDVGVSVGVLVGRADGNMVGI